MCTQAELAASYAESDTVCHAELFSVAAYQRAVKKCKK